MRDALLPLKGNRPAGDKQRPYRWMAWTLASIAVAAAVMVVLGQRHASAVEQAFRTATQQEWAARIVVVDETAAADAFTITFDLFFIDEQEGEAVERLRTEYPLAAAAGEDEIEERRRSFVRAFDSLAERYGIRFLGAVWPDLTGGGPEPAKDPAAYLWRFSDVEGHRAAATIEALAVKGLFRDDEGDEFRPADPITRAELLHFLDRATGAQWEGEAEPGDYWAWHLVLGALEDGVFDLDNYEDRAFYPEETALRWEAAVLTVGALSAAYPELAAGDLNDGDLQVQLERRLADAGEIPQHALRAVYLALDWGLMEAAGDEGFAPQDELERGEAAVILERAVALVAGLDS